MKTPIFERTPLFETKGSSHYRIPSMAVTNSGTIVVICNDRRESVDDRVKEQWLVSRRMPGGKLTEPVQVLASKKDWSCNIQNMTYDREKNRLIAMYREFEWNPDTSVKWDSLIRYAMISEDDGVTWIRRETPCLPNNNGLVGSTHGSGAGIQLLRGEHKGRLVSCARVTRDHSADNERLAVLQTQHYNCSIYSDDHGMTWKTGGEVQPGTGEGVLCELSDGTIYLNSRAYFYDGMRRIAYSHDAGETFGDFANEPQLPEIDFGVNAALVCLQGRGENGDDLLVYTSLDDRKIRRNMTAWLSFDGGKTWPHKKLIDSGRSAYSTMAYDEKLDLFYLAYECGVNDPYDLGIYLARFNKEWLLEK